MKSISRDLSRKYSDIIQRISLSTFSKYPFVCLKNSFSQGFLQNFFYKFLHKFFREFTRKLCQEFHPTFFQHPGSPFKIVPQIARLFFTSSFIDSIRIFSKDSIRISRWNIFRNFFTVFPDIPARIFVPVRVSFRCSCSSSKKIILMMTKN